jgi:hypothetical protein
MPHAVGRLFGARLGGGDRVVRDCGARPCPPAGSVSVVFHVLSRTRTQRCCHDRQQQSSAVGRHACFGRDERARHRRGGPGSGQLQADCRRDRCAGAAEIRGDPDLRPPRGCGCERASAPDTMDASWWFCGKRVLARPSRSPSWRSRHQDLGRRRLTRSRSLAPASSTARVRRRSTTECSSFDAAGLPTWVPRGAWRFRATPSASTPPAARSCPVSSMPTDTSRTRAACSQDRNSSRVTISYDSSRSTRATV